MIGRKAELSILEKAYTSSKPELIAVIGRRRVGKTFLIRSFFQDKIDFEIVGLKSGTKEQQLRNFSYSLKEYGKKDALEVIPKDWLEAFFQLKEFLVQTKKPAERKVVFIDELPWIATKRSDFLTGFSYFWNSYAAKNNIVIIICGSATAWMIKKIINNRGGLHNRVTRKILLSPFTLAETETYFSFKNIHLDRYQILQIYMAMGGIPHYLEEVEQGKSATQIIDEICFHPLGLLRTEFDNLYSSLFSNPERYEAIVSILAGKWTGLSRIAILKALKIKDGGGLSMILKELEQSGFITSYLAFNKKRKETIFRLTDNYSLFYLKFIKNSPSNETHQWETLSQTQSWISWSGYAFENICLQHIPQIKIALGISGVQTSHSSFHSKSTQNYEGTQIDLIIDRQDRVISLCEAKFYNDELALTKEIAKKIRRKRTIFKESTKTKKQVFITLLTTYGLLKNQHSLGLIDNVVDMDDLFK